MVRLREILGFVDKSGLCFRPGNRGNHFNAVERPARWRGLFGLFEKNERFSFELR